MKSAVLGMVVKLARQNAGNKTLNELHMLQGYVQLLCMDEGIVNKLLPDEANKEELTSIRSMFDGKEIDVDMMKKGLGLLLACDVKEDVLHTAEEESFDGKSADIYLKELLEDNEEVVRVFKKGCTLEDTVRFKNSVAVSPEKKKAEADPVNQERPDDKEHHEGDKTDQESEETLFEAEEEKQEGIEPLTLKARDLYYSLRENIIGQDDAIDIFIEGYFKAEMFAGVSDMPNKPSAVFLFAGPPGVGKTLLATEAARVLERPCLRLNMSEYSDSQSVTELIGVSKKFAQASRGKLTSYVKAHPNAVVIFDEIEKAHLTVVQLFLQILDAGVLQDSFEEADISFKDTLLIFTTNAGKALYEENRDKNLSQMDPEVLLDALQREGHPTRPGPLFPAAICSRFSAGNVVMFNHLQTRQLRQIVKMNYDSCLEKLEKKYHWNVRYDNRLPELFLYIHSAKLDARIISSKSFEFIQEELYEYFRQAVEKADLEKIRNIDLRINYDGIGDDVYRLFNRENKTGIVMMSDYPVKNTETDDYRIICVENEEALINALSEAGDAFVIADPDFGIQDNGKDYGFSLDDIASSGMMAFHRIHMQSPDVPVYILDRDNRLRETDRTTFTRQGARGFVPCSTTDPDVFCNALETIVSENYLQEQIQGLANKGKHLSYNTAQKISDDGETAVIEFYGFKIYTAIDASDQQAVLDNANRPKTTFDDVIGARNAKEELKYFVEFLKNPRKYMLNGGTPPKGILLYGPPGTGKTMLARAMAGEADATFFAVNATDFMNKYVGEGEDRIRNIFRAARKYAPSIIFIDEIDAIAKERTGESHVETYLNALMTEMDGFKFDAQKPVFVLAATNFAVERSQAAGRSMIDPALMRRFDNKIKVDLPKKEEREEYIRLCLNKSKIDSVSDDIIKNLADRTMGESLANIQNMIHLAIRNAGKAGTPVTDAILLNALEEYYHGEEHHWNGEYYEHVARHEAGHTYVAFLSGQVPSYVTIVSRGDFGGYMMPASDEDVPTYTREDLLWKIRIALAGRASEIVFYGKESGTNTGVSSDLQMATKTALNMVSRYGMDDHTLLSLDMKNMLSSDYGRQVIERAEAILQEELKNTIKLVEEGKDKIAKLAEELMRNNQLVGKEIEAILM